MTKPVRLAVFCSGSASSLRYLYEHDPAFGKAYTVVGLFSNKAGASGIDFARDKGIPLLILNFRQWCRESGFSVGGQGVRELYFAVVSQLISAWSTDAILLSGFMLIVTDPLLSQYEGRILNVHPADLRIKEADGRRKYTGLNVVARAMDAGDPTASTVHIINAETDMGPIVAVSEPLSYQSGDDADRHQSLMKTSCDGPAYVDALNRLIAAGWPTTPWQP